MDIILDNVSEVSSQTVGGGIVTDKSCEAKIGLNQDNNSA